MVRLSLAGGQTDNRASPDRFIQGLAELSRVEAGLRGFWGAPTMSVCVCVCSGDLIDRNSSIRTNT